MIDAKIMIEIPFPIPFSVISSPSHTKNTVPAVMVSMIVKIVSGSPMFEMIGVFD